MGRLSRGLDISGPTAVSPAGRSGGLSFLRVMVRLARPALQLRARSGAPPARSPRAHGVPTGNRREQRPGPGRDKREGAWQIDASDTATHGQNGSRHRVFGPIFRIREAKSQKHALMPHCGISPSPTAVPSAKWSNYRQFTILHTHNACPPEKRPCRPVQPKPDFGPVPANRPPEVDMHSRPTR